MVKIAEQSYYGRWHGNKLSVDSVVKSLVREVLRVAKEEINKPPKSLKILDAGCGEGRYAIELSKHVKKIVGVEPYKRVFDTAQTLKKKAKRKNIVFYNSSIEDFKSREKFDLVLSLTTIEHMPNAKKSFKQTLRLMKKDAIIYLTAPNKWWPFEEHYKLPFLSWLPLWLANIYIQISGRGKDYTDSGYALSYFGMKKLFDNLNCNYKFVLPSDINSAYIGCGNRSLFYNTLKNAGVYLIKFNPFFWIFSKGFIMIISKK